MGARSVRKIIGWAPTLAEAGEDLLGDRLSRTREVATSSTAMWIGAQYLQDHKGFTANIL